MEIKRNGNQRQAVTIYFVDRRVADVRWERDWDEYRKEPNPNGDGGRHRVRHWEKAEKSLSILVEFEPDHDRPSSNNFYDYNIVLSLDDIVEIIKALSSSIDSKSRPAIQEAIGPHVGELLAIALAASDYQSKLNLVPPKPSVG